MYVPLFVVTYFLDAKTSIGLFRERESLPLLRPNMNQVVPASTPQTARLTVVSISAEERVKSQKGPRHGIWRPDARETEEITHTCNFTLKGSLAYIESNSWCIPCHSLLHALVEQPTVLEARTSLAAYTQDGSREHGSMGGVESSLCEEDPLLTMRKAAEVSYGVGYRKLCEWEVQEFPWGSILKIYLNLVHIYIRRTSSVKDCMSLRTSSTYYRHLRNLLTLLCM